MELKVGDIVEFKNWEYMTGDERMMIDKEFFPLYGKVKVINAKGCDRFFNIEEKAYTFCTGSVARVISDIDINELNIGDEVWVKTTVNACYDDAVFINPVERFINKNNVLKIVKHKEPEHFIVQEDYYGMYIGVAQELVPDKDVAKIYTSRYTANEDAADMHLNAWDVIHV